MLWMSTNYLCILLHEKKSGNCFDFITSYVFDFVPVACALISTCVVILGGQHKRAHVDDIDDNVSQ